MVCIVQRFQYYAHAAYSALFPNLLTYNNRSFYKAQLYHDGIFLKETII